MKHTELLTRCTGSLVGAGLLAAAALALTATLSLPNPSFAENLPSVQYANVAPLPGAGTALNAQGKPDGLGSVQVNIPIAYTPGYDYVNVSAYTGGYFLGSAMEENRDSPLPNGTAVVGVGFGGRPRLYVSLMAVSSLVFTESKALNAQLQLVEEGPHTPALAIGTQDLLNKEWRDVNARAYYGVATKSVPLKGRNLYLSAGYGSGRFLDRPFVGASLPLSSQFNFSTEYDGFQFNQGIDWRPGGRFGSLTFLGAYDSRTGWLVGANLARDSKEGWLLGLGTMAALAFL